MTRDKHLYYINKVILQYINKVDLSMDYQEMAAFIRQFNWKISFVGTNLQRCWKNRKANWGTMFEPDNSNIWKSVPHTRLGEM